MKKSKDILSDTVIVIPTKRLPPLKTLISYPTKRKIILIVDPSILSVYKEWIRNNNIKNICAVKGKVGMAAQAAECYRQSYKAGYKFYFRMDDDLHSKTFVDKKGCPDLECVMLEARRCAEVLNTSLTGFVNTSVRLWLGKGYKRSYGLIHGGAHLCRSAKNPSEFVNESLPAYEDVYRSAAHRMKDGAVGRVCFIGLDKRASLRNSSFVKTARIQSLAKKIILSKFPTIVTCSGYRILDRGQQRIPNWRMKRGQEYRG